jgi:hypothetical protein
MNWLHRCEYTSGVGKRIVARVRQCGVTDTKLIELSKDCRDEAVRLANRMNSEQRRDSPASEFPS